MAMTDPGKKAAKAGRMPASHAGVTSHAGPYQPAVPRRFMSHLMPPIVPA